jgi:pyridoxal phosphate-dependent aminotransferase EpsN
MARILLSVPHIGSHETAFVREAFESNSLSTLGPHVAAFERELEARLGVPATAVSSGTAAIHLGLRTLGVGLDDEVFCQSLTSVATANPIRYLGANPVFIDSDRATWNMDPWLLSRALQDRARHNRLPKAVIVVHLLGQCADMDPILQIAGRYHVPVLEDATEALGATYKGRPAGSLGDAAAFSFNGNKIITTTGGGAMVSPRSDRVEKARFWATHAREAEQSFQHNELGYNYRMSDLLAAIGRGQLRVLDLRVQQRRAIAFRYLSGLADLPGITLMPQAPFGLHTNWLSCFLIDEARFGRSRDQLVLALDAGGIETRPLWKPLHLQPVFESCPQYGGAVAEELFRRGICLPSSSSLTLDDQLLTINRIRAIAGAPLIDSFLDADFQPRAKAAAAALFVS